VDLSTLDRSRIAHAVVAAILLQVNAGNISKEILQLQFSVIGVTA
jgi:hypothetical protein